MTKSALSCLKFPLNILFESWWQQFDDSYSPAIHCKSLQTMTTTSGVVWPKINKMGIGFRLAPTKMRAHLSNAPDGVELLHLLVRDPSRLVTWIQIIFSN